MNKIDKSKKDNLMQECIDYMHKNNNAMMRERYVFFMPDRSFVFVEGNTNGWYIEEAMSEFYQVYSFLDAT